ncbi:hypothetical protein OF83DRAFT_851836 [Amylostereum chailletii]|nr:hypothetical protein OF83DRAFT_851836 [Amylostereum chailletii]
MDGDERPKYWCLKTQKVRIGLVSQRRSEPVTISTLLGRYYWVLVVDDPSNDDIPSDYLIPKDEPDEGFWLAWSKPMLTVPPATLRCTYPREQHESTCKFVGLQEPNVFNMEDPIYVDGEEEVGAGGRDQSPTFQVLEQVDDAGHPLVLVRLSFWDGVTRHYMGKRERGSQLEPLTDTERKRLEMGIPETEVRAMATCILNGRLLVGHGHRSRPSSYHRRRTSSLTASTHSRSTPTYYDAALPRSVSFRRGLQDGRTRRARMIVRAKLRGR